MQLQVILYTSNVLARGAGTLFTGAQRLALVNTEGDGDGKNHRYAENHVFR